jgi:hypothetical protein
MNGPIKRNKHFLQLMTQILGLTSAVDLFSICRVNFDNGGLGILSLCFTTISMGLSISSKQLLVVEIRSYSS